MVEGYRSTEDQVCDHMESESNRISHYDRRYLELLSTFNMKKGIAMETNTLWRKALCRL